MVIPSSENPVPPVNKVKDRNSVLQRHILGNHLQNILLHHTKGPNLGPMLQKVYVDVIFFLVIWCRFFFLSLFLHFSFILYNNVNHMSIKCEVRMPGALSPAQTYFKIA